MDSAQVGVAVSGMANEFPGSVRQASQRLAEKGIIAVVVIANQRTGLNHSYHTVGRKQSSALGPLPKLAGESMQHADLAIAFPELRLAFEQARGQRFDRNNRIADGAHAANPRRAQQRSEDLRKDVGVLVGIEVRHLETGGLNLPDLRRDFLHQLVAIKASKHGARGESRKPGIKLFRFGRAHRDQRIQRRRLRHGSSIDQHNVATDGEIWSRARRCHRVFESGAVGH